MKRLLLRAGKFALVDDRDFVWASEFKWHLITSPRSRTSYAARHDPENHSRLILLHRQVLGEPSGKVDHIDRNGLNCCRENLRRATNSQSAHNVGLRSDNSSGYKGVSWDSQYKKWQAGIQVNYRRIRLGRFSSRRGAARAYDAAAIEFHGEFARLNFPGRSVKSPNGATTEQLIAELSRRLK